MSAVAARVRAPSRPAPLGRLVAVELRKAVDTRSGFWLLATIGLLSLLSLAVMTVVHSSGERSMGDLFEVALTVPSLLLPIVGILLVTDEFAHRTALTTFSLVPDRRRVVAAKLLAALALAVLVTAACLALTALAVIVGKAAGLEGISWSIGARHFGGQLLHNLLSVAMGFGFGLLLLSTPLAIVLYFLVPMAWSFAVTEVKFLSKVEDWLDTGAAWSPLLDADGSVHWGHVVAAAALWIAVPITAGLVRLQRTEIK